VLGAVVAAPLLGVVGAVVSVTNAARKVVSATRSSEGHGLDLVTQILRTAAEEGPLVLLVDDADQVEGSWWSDLLQGFASEIASNLQLFIVMTVDGPATLGSKADDEPDWLSTAERLVDDGVAEWHPVGSVTHEQVREWVGNASPMTVARLIELTGGMATLTSQMWEDWRATGVVNDDTGQWTFSANYRERVPGRAGDVVRRRLATLIRDEGSRKQAYALLAAAALEGMRFTPAAAAHVVDFDIDTALATLSTISDTPDQPLGLVVKLKRVTVEMQDGNRKVERYAFTSTLAWWSLQRYGLLPSEAADAAAKLATSLVEIYGDVHPVSVRPLARLYEMTGQPELARRFRRIADHGLAGTLSPGRGVGSARPTARAGTPGRSGARWTWRSPRRSY
jgi:hypothetical protein